MTTTQKVDQLLSALDQVVQKSLVYFAGPGANSRVKIGDWEPREVLCHMIYWHQATAEGMESVTAEGQPTRIYAPTDEMNARSVGRKSGKSVQQLVDEMRALHQRLAKAAKAMPNPDAAVLIRANGTEMSTVQRLEAMANHWKEHLAQMQAGK